MGTAAQEVVREVGVSHCNNIKSLTEHAHASDTTHYTVDTLRKELLSFMWDLGYYLTKKERMSVVEVFDDVQHACDDMHFKETINNYHKHHFDINRQTELKGQLALVHSQAPHFTILRLFSLLSPTCYFVRLKKLFTMSNCYINSHAD